MQPKTTRILVAAAVAIALPLVGLSQLGRSDGSVDAAEYTADGRLVFPADTDRWVVLGSGLGGDYNDEAFDPSNPGAISLVQMEPRAYEQFLQTGRYADGSMFLLTFFATLEKTEPRLNGFAQGEPVAREIHVIDRDRFTSEGRGFFLFQGDTPATAMPLGSECVVCHTEHGAFDGTFTQFYPTIRSLTAQ